MNSFLKIDKNLLTYTLIILLIIPFFGFKFFVSFIGNILLLLFLIPLFLLLLGFLFFKYYKSKSLQCRNCGTISLGLNKTCVNCGSDLENNSNTNQFDQKPSESTIEVEAEEIK